MKTTILGTALALTIASAIPLAMAQTPAAQVQTPAVTTKAASPMTATDVSVLLSSKGFTEINDGEFKDGTWTADAKSADGNHVEVRIDADTREVFADEAVATIGKDEIVAKVQAAGYTNVHDVAVEDGVWKVEANDAQGKDVEIRLNPNDGSIIGSEKDKVDAGK
jgi:hypothetical protein